LIAILIVVPAAGIAALGRLRADEVQARQKAAATAAFEEARRLLADGKDARSEFRRAADGFHEATNDLFHTPGTCRNIGNAAFLADDLPHAIYAFRVGLSLDLHDPVLRANLAYARAQVAYPPGARGRPPADTWPSWLPRWHTGALLGAGLVAYSAACIAALGWWFRRRRWLLVAALVGFGLSAAGVHGWRLLCRQSQMDRDFPLVVIAFDQTDLRTGNGPSYPRHPDLPMLRRGMEARGLGQRGDWIQIQFASGETGWVPLTDTWHMLPS
jgi:hypothetical protein